MLQFERIHHVSLAVRDLRVAEHFYSEVLQFQRIERPPFESRGIWYAIGRDQQLHLLEHPVGETLRSKPIDTTDGHFAIWVTSYRKTIEWLEERGVDYEARPDSIAGFSQIYILDPDCNIIELGAAYHS